MEKIALVGIGEIARTQHVPVLSESTDWELATTVSRLGTVDGVTAYSDFDTMLSENPDIKTVSLCVPPQPRFEYATKAIAAGRNVMLEKPPGQSLAEVHALQTMAIEAGVSLFTTWHSRAASGIQLAKEWLADKTVTGGFINWKESVRKYHMGQDWIFEPGGMGVFDPGINALSILTEILPMPTHLTAAELVFPKNRDTPISAELHFHNNIRAVFDWTVENEQFWDIDVTTTAGTINLKDGGSRIIIDGQETLATEDVEYKNLYSQMAELVRNKQSDVDLSPMIHVADAFTLGKRRVTDAFEW